jgi:hypothetical protein
MLAEDARWAMDVILSGQQASKISGFIPLLMGHHFVRIAHEGAIALRSPNSHLGVPELADLLRGQYGAITARARHTTKLLDDTKKSYEEVLFDLGDILGEHNARLTGNAFRWARWLETDLGLYLCQGRLAGATVPAAYRLGLDVTDSGTISGEDLRAVSEEWGGTLVVLGAAALDSSTPTATLDLERECKITYRDKKSSQYFRRRFESEFPSSIKVLLLLIEGDVNTALTLLPQTAAGHEQSSFRARTITMYHSLTALQRVLDRYPSLDTNWVRKLGSLLADAPTRRLLSPEGRQVRNRCMHYELRDPRVRIDLSLPMFGIVEAVYPGNSWDRFERDLSSVARRVADHMHDWRPGEHGR